MYIHSHKLKLVASINYRNNNGALEIESKDKINILEKTSFSKRTLSNHLLDETVIIYDTLDNKFYEENYKNAEYNKGNALTLVSEDEVSNTFLNVITPINKKGFSFRKKINKIVFYFFMIMANFI